MLLFFFIYASPLPGFQSYIMHLLVETLQVGHCIILGSDDFGWMVVNFLHHYTVPTFLNNSTRFSVKTTPRSSVPLAIINNMGWGELNELKGTTARDPESRVVSATTTAAQGARTPCECAW